MTQGLFLMMEAHTHEYVYGQRQKLPSSRDHCPAGVDITQTVTSLSATRKVLPLIPYIRKWARNPPTYFITS